MANNENPNDPNAVEGAGDKDIQLRHIKSKEIVDGGVFIFQLSSITLFVILVISLLILTSDHGKASPGFSYFVLFSAKTLLTLSVVSIFAAMLGHRLQQGWLIGFTFLVLAALVIPTYEIIRYVYALTGNKSTVTDDGSSSLQTRIKIYRNITPEECKSADLESGMGGSPFSHKISDHIREIVARNEVSGIADEWYCEVRSAIDIELSNYFEIESADRVINRGSEDILFAVYYGNFPNFILGFHDDRSVERELLLLKSDNLVAFPQGDFRHPSPTIFGCRVVTRIKFESEQNPLIGMKDIESCKQFLPNPPTESEPQEVVEETGVQTGQGSP